MNLIRIGEIIINMANVIAFERVDDGWVKVYTTAHSKHPVKVDCLEFTGDEAKALWERLCAIERSGKPGQP